MGRNLDHIPCLRFVLLTPSSQRLSPAIPATLIQLSRQPVLTIWNLLDREKAIRYSRISSIRQTHRCELSLQTQTRCGILYSSGRYCLLLWQERHVTIVLRPLLVSQLHLLEIYKLQRRLLALNRLQLQAARRTRRRGLCHQG